MGRFFSKFYLLAVACVSHCVVADNTPVLLATDSSAFYNAVNGINAPSSIVEATNVLLVEKLQLEQRILLFPTSRLLKELAETSGPMCTFFRIANEERREQYLFSLPTDIFLSHRVYQSRRLNPIPDKYLAAPNTIQSLSAYVNETDAVRLLYMQDTSMGDVIDQQIRQILTDKKYAIFGENIYERFMKMFEIERFNLMIQYPAIMLDFPELQVKMRTYRLADNESFVSGHIMCNKTDVSQQFIHTVDAALREIYPTDAFSDAILRFTPKLDHESVKEFIRERLVDHD